MNDILFNSLDLNTLKYNIIEKRPIQKKLTDQIVKRYFKQYGRNFK